MLIHVMTATGETQAIRAQRGVAFVFWPCLINTLTTCMGLALGISACPLFRTWDTMVRLDLSLPLCFRSCSVALERPFSCVPNPTDKGLIIQLVSKLSDLAVRSPREVLSVAGVVALLSLLGITRIQVDTYSIDFLKDHILFEWIPIFWKSYGPYTRLSL